MSCKMRFVKVTSPGKWIKGVSIPHNTSLLPNAGLRRISPLPTGQAMQHSFMSGCESDYTKLIYYQTYFCPFGFFYQETCSGNTNLLIPANNPPDQLLSSKSNRLTFITITASLAGR